jgi:hypothetical protein
MQGYTPLRIMCIGFMLHDPLQANREAQAATILSRMSPPRPLAKHNLWVKGRASPFNHIPVFWGNVV